MGQFESLAQEIKEDGLEQNAFFRSNLPFSEGENDEEGKVSDVR